MGVVVTIKPKLPRAPSLYITETTRIWLLEGLSLVFSAPAVCLGLIPWWLGVFYDVVLVLMVVWWFIFIELYEAWKCTIFSQTNNGRCDDPSWGIGKLIAEGQYTEPSGAGSNLLFYGSLGGSILIAICVSIQVYMDVRVLKASRRPFLREHILALRYRDGSVPSVAHVMEFQKRVLGTSVPDRPPPSVVHHAMQSVTISEYIRFRVVFNPVAIIYTSHLLGAGHFMFVLVRFGLAHVCAVFTYMWMAGVGPSCSHDSEAERLDHSDDCRRAHTLSIVYGTIACVLCAVWLLSFVRSINLFRDKVEKKDGVKIQRAFLRFVEYKETSSQRAE